MHLLLVLRVGNKKFAHIFEGKNITQPRRSISPDRYLDFRLQPAAGAASTSRVASTCRMDSASALRSRSSCCCRVFHCLRLESSHTSTQNSAFRPRKRISVTFWAVSRTYPIQLNCAESRARGPGGIGSKDFPSYARSAFVHNEIVRSLSHGKVPCHRPWTFPSISQELTRNANSDSGIA